MNPVEQTLRARKLTIACGRIFSREEPGPIGAALAQLMATLLIGHKIPDDADAEHELRERMFELWIQAVRSMIAAAEKTERR